MERDIHFYHFILARELKRVQADMVSGKLFSTCLARSLPNQGTSLRDTHSQIPSHPSDIFANQ